MTLSANRDRVLGAVQSRIPVGAAPRGHQVSAVAADFLGHDCKIEHVAAKSAVSLGEWQSEQPGLHPGE